MFVEQFQILRHYNWSYNSYWHDWAQQWLSAIDSNISNIIESLELFLSQYSWTWIQYQTDFCQFDRCFRTVEAATAQAEWSKLNMLVTSVDSIRLHLVKSLVLTYLLWEWILRWNVAVVGSTLTECFGCSSNNVKMSWVMNNVSNIIKSMWNVKVDKSHLRWRIWLWFTIVTNNNISQAN